MIAEFEGNKPKIHKSCFIAENATVLGKVEIEKNSSIWFGTVLRGDENYIKIGKNVSIQDNSVVHVSLRDPVKVSNNVIIGHKAIIHGTQIGSNTLIGMGAILLSGSKIGKNCIIGAGALITEKQEIPDNSIAVGTPAKIIKEITKEHKKRIEGNWKEYVDLNERFMKWQNKRK